MKVENRQVVSQNKFKNVKTYRKQHGLTQNDLACLLGVNRVTVARWENGVFLPSDDNIIKMAEIFGVNPEKLEMDLKVNFSIKQLQSFQVSKEDVLCMMS